MEEREEHEIQARGFRIAAAPAGQRAIVGRVASIDALVEVDNGHARISLAWPSCGLGLRVRPRTFRDAFRRNHLLPRELAGTLFAEARSPDRAAALLAAPIFPKVGANSTVLSDTSLYFTRTAPARLAPLLDDIIALAGRIDNALQAMPLPPLFAPHEAAWRAAAQALGGRLERGTASLLDFTVGGSPATLRSVWSSDDDFLETAIAVGPHEVRSPRPSANPLLLLPTLEELVKRGRVAPPAAPYR